MGHDSEASYASEVMNSNNKCLKPMHSCSCFLAWCHAIFTSETQETQDKIISSPYAEDVNQFVSYWWLDIPVYSFPNF